MKPTQTKPIPVATSDLSPADQLRAYFEAIRDESATIERAAAEAEHLVEIAARTTDPEKRRACNLDLAIKNQEGAVAKMRAQTAAKNLAQAANILLAELGSMQGRASRLLSVLYSNVLESARQTLAPFFENRALQSAAEASAVVREQQAFNERNSPVIAYGNQLENDGAGGVRLCAPINVPALLNAHGEQKRCLASIEERARKLGLSLDAIRAQLGVPAAVSGQRRRVITPSKETRATHRVQLRVLESVTIGYVDGKLVPAGEKGEILDLPYFLPVENIGCLAHELMASERVEVAGKLPAMRPRNFVSALDLNQAKAGASIL